MSGTTLAGVDEAGLGPILGPLVVSGVGLEVGDAAPDHDLWPRLAGFVCRRGDSVGDRLVVDDSKRVLAPLRGRVDLELAVLALVSHAGGRPGTLAELVARVAPAAGAAAAQLPWYGSCELGLPVWAAPAEVDGAASRLGRGLEHAGCRLAAVVARMLFAPDLNRLVEDGHSKAEAAFTRVGEVMAEVVGDAAVEVDLRVDRLGGRKHYRDHLLRVWPGGLVWSRVEEREISCYRVELDGRRLEVAFAVGGDRTSFVVAFASMLSKYLRELFMVLLNRYWAMRVPDLRATAGYPVDGRRFLDDIETELSASGLDRGSLVRCR